MKCRNLLPVMLTCILLPMIAKSYRPLCGYIICVIIPAITGLSAAATLTSFGPDASPPLPS